MGEALRAETVVGKGRKVSLELETPNLPEGTRLNVIFEPVGGDEAEKFPVTHFFGKARGLFGSAQEVIDHIREERDAWDEQEGK